MNGIKYRLAALRILDLFDIPVQPQTICGTRCVIMKTSAEHLAPLLSSGQRPIGAYAVRFNAILKDNWHQLGQDTKLKGGVIWHSAFIFVQADYDSQL
jgi:hypothetical protein